MAVLNPRFPHTCKIYREEGASNFSSGVDKTIYEGECRMEGNTSVRTFKVQNVVKADYRLQIPGQVLGVKAGDLLDVTDRQGTFYRCAIADAFAGNLGTSVYFNITRN